MPDIIPDFRRLIDFYGKNGARYAFELLCKELLSLEIPDSKPIEPNPGDKGIDVFSGTFSEKITVFQVKFFPYKIEETQKNRHFVTVEPNGSSK